MKDMIISCLYVNHKKANCGVYEFGKLIGDLLITSKKYNFHYCECNSLTEFLKVYKDIKPKIIIYNYHPSTMNWIDDRRRIAAPYDYHFNTIHIGTIHEVHQELADKTNNDIFDFHVAPDPTLMLKNSLVYKTGRLLPQKATAIKEENKIPVIGSFGFATYGKGFEKIIDLVQNEFDEAIIRLNIPFAKYGDSSGEIANELAINLHKKLNKPNIKLEIKHDYLGKEELLSFLSSNSINVFLYEDANNRGISSTTDWALASGKPIAISNSRMFRHLFHCEPSIVVDNGNSISTIMANGVIPIEHLYEEYNADIILWEYEKMIADVLYKVPETNDIEDSLKKKLFHTILNLRLGFLLKNSRILKRIFRSILMENKHINVWTKEEDKIEVKKLNKNVEYLPVELPENFKLNRILDNYSRKIYSSTISFLEIHFPKLIAKKIAEANIQQAFILDSTVRLSQNINNPKILGVGAFEDTAIEALKLLKYDIHDIDPILNYDLGTFRSKPNTKEESFDIVVSTSVIEHVFDDEQFMKDIVFLLKKGGYAILTCDYKDQYKKGDDIPEVDYRLYTQNDIKKRLMKAIPEADFIDIPEWDCEKPDFYYLDGKYNFTFASIVIKKRK